MTKTVSEKTSIQFYADDTILYREIRLQHDIEELNSDLNKLEKMGRKFDAQKCEKLTVTRKRQSQRGSYQLNNHNLCEVIEAKYLGVTITLDLRWNSHVTKIVHKANVRLGFLRQNLHIKQQHIKEMAYKSLVKPLVEYACAVWSPSTDCLKSQIEMTQ